MKRSILLLVAAILFTCSISCKKSSSNKKDPYKCAACVTVSEAKAANDASSKGIYVGVLIGSTGTIKFDLANGGSTFTAVMVIDGTSVTLISQVTWVAGQSFTSPFMGTLNGQPVTINFEVGATGAEPTVTSANIPGHPNAEFIIAKETSAALIEAFEGTYSTTKPESGTFNLVISVALGRWGAIAKKDGTSDISHDDGTITNNVLTDTDNQILGTISGDELNGKFNDNDGKTVTITGKRTL